MYCNPTEYEETNLDNRWRLETRYDKIIYENEDYVTKVKMCLLREMH